MAEASGDLGRIRTEVPGLVQTHTVRVVEGLSYLGGQRLQVLGQDDRSPFREEPCEGDLVVVDVLAEIATSRHDDRDTAGPQGVQHRSGSALPDDDVGGSRARCQLFVLREGGTRDTMQRRGSTVLDEHLLGVEETTLDQLARPPDQPSERVVVGTDGHEDPLSVVHDHSTGPTTVASG